MNRQQHLLIILAEECNELAQEIAKALRFGIDEQRDLPTSNRERIQKEYNDILAVVDLVNRENLPFDMDFHRDEKLIEAKRKKVARYMDYSQSLGILEPTHTRAGDSDEQR